MENRNLLIAIFFLIAILMIVPLISAAGLTSTWNSKGATGLNYSNLTTSFTFNCTSSNKAVTNVTIYANKTTGVMNPLQSYANTSVAQTAWTGTVSIQAADDGSNQNLSCYVRNSTANAYSNEKGAWHVRLDSTSPGCNITILHPTIAWKGLQTITYASSDVLARRLTTVDINGPEDQTTTTVTAQSRTVELGSNDTKYTGSWTVNMTVTDWSGNSCTDSKTFKSYMPGKEPPSEPTKDSSTILIIIVLAIVAWFIFGRKK